MMCAVPAVYYWYYSLEKTQVFGFKDKHLLHAVTTHLYGAT